MVSNGTMPVFTNTTRPPIEDHFGDCLAKAQVGQGVAVSDLTAACGASAEMLRRWKRGCLGVAERGLLSRAAEAVGLNARALLALADGAVYPVVTPVEGLLGCNTPFGGDMTVNAYVVFDPATREAVVFDSGTDAAPLLAIVAENRLAVTAVCLTHGHRDHVAALGALTAETAGATVYAHPAENVTAAVPLEPGQPLGVGGLTVTPRLTAGHSPGGLTYVVAGLKRPIAVVGDAVFCGSVGGIRQAYRAALAAIDEEILTLPPETLLCPGHGPVTTVAHERRINPFFA